MTLHREDKSSPAAIMLHHARGGNAGVTAGPCDEMTMGSTLGGTTRLAARKRRGLVMAIRRG
ncbi:hypothetical protein CV770_22045 [Bradyrhizobium sp. AC87j1]|nr:hypothetical protein CV770_22045 [Bradyrhizobium sp. AC87j1]